MAEELGPLGLRIPKQTEDGVPAPYFRSRDAERWIESLPIAHLGETSRQVFKALVEINRTGLTLAQRYRLLELFAPPVDYVVAALERHFVGQSFPLPAKNRKIAELARELLSEMAIGYKIIVEESLGSDVQRVDGRLLIQSVYGAIRNLGALLLRSYQIYAPPPDNVWLEIHHLFLFAQHNELHDRVIKGGAVQHDTIEALYKRILLLALANPYRLPQADIAAIYAAAEGWTPHAQLLALLDPDAPPGLFAVDLDRDAPPGYYVPGEVRSEHFMILDPSDLVRIIRGDGTDFATVDESYAKGYANAGLAQSTLRRLILSWGAVPKRSFSRTGKQSEVEVTLGLSATHYFMEKEHRQLLAHMADVAVQFGDRARTIEAANEAMPAYNNRSHFDRAPGDAVDARDSDLWDSINNPPLNFDTVDFPTYTRPPAIKPPPAPEDVYKVFVCNKTNESAGGCCLLWKNGTPTKTMVGMLIGIRPTGPRAEGGWSIGVIRWMKNVGANTMVLGVEMLAPTAEAIAARRVIGTNNQTSDYMRSLLLPELRNVNQPEMIITPALFKEGDTVAINVGIQESRIRLAKLKESTGSFSQFHFVLLGSEEKKSVRSKIQSDPAQEFESIWTSI